MSQLIKNYLKLEAHFKQITHLQNLAALIQTDAETNLPPGSAPSRHQELGTLVKVIHGMATASSLKSVIKAAIEETPSLDAWQKSNLSIIQKEYEHAQCISPELQAAYSIATSECELTWRTARQANDFASLIPSLNRVFELARQIAHAKSQHFGMDPYDILMDAYDPSRTSQEVQGVYDTLKVKLPKLVAQITAKQQAETLIPLSEKIGEQTQQAIGLRIMEKMGFNFDKGRLDKSAHPFCNGSNDDVRLTTRYDESNLMTGIFGIIHETGHGLYQQNLPAGYRDQPVGQAKGMAFHESQSLIMECQACISPEFMQFLAKLLRDEFGLKGAAYSAENLYKLQTRVKPSLIRVDADEVTYPLHVILRFEIEKCIIKDNLQAADIPALWNAKMQEYVGIVPPTDRDGCMQDIHWPAGLLGYFPAYTNGAIIGSMLMKAAQTKHPSLKKQLMNGNFQELNTYLNEKLRCWGSMKDSAELLQTATGYTKINPDTFIDYLQHKYLS